MSIDVEDEIGRVSVGLTRLIAMELHSMSTEYWQPRYQTDQSEAEMTFRKKRIARLRELRQEFEDIMHGLTREAL